MIPVIIPLATEVAADFGIGYIVQGGVTSAIHYGSLSLAKKDNLKSTLITFNPDPIDYIKKTKSQTLYT